MIPPSYMTPYLEQVLSLIPTPPWMSRTWQVVKTNTIETAFYLNERYGLSYDNWVALGRIVVRALAPFLAALVTIIVLPAVVVPVVLPFIIMGVTFLSAFYGLPDRLPPVPKIGIDLFV